MYALTCIQQRNITRRSTWSFDAYLSHLPRTIIEEEGGNFLVEPEEQLSI